MKISDLDLLVEGHLVKGAIEKAFNLGLGATQTSVESVLSGYLTYI